MKNKLKLCLLVGFTTAILNNTNYAQAITFQWAKGFGGASMDYGLSVAVDASGNVCTTGFFNGTVDFDPGAGIFNLTSAGLNDVFVSKLDAAGNFLWAKKLGGSNNDQGYSIAVDASGNVYTTGYFNATADFDPGPGTVNLTPVGVRDVFVSKLDASGNYVWAKSLGGASTDESRSIAIDASGNVFTTGFYNGTADFDPGAGTANLTSAGGTDIFVSKLDASGNYVWAKSLGGALINDVGYSIAVDASGNVYTTGSFQGTADFNPGAAIANLTSAGGTDIFVSKLDASGNYIWGKKLGGTGSDLGNSIAVHQSGNVFTTGYFGGTADFDPGAATANLTSAGGIDVFVSKLDASGNYVWAKQLGGSSSDIGNSIGVDALGDVYTTGLFNATADFDPGLGTSNLTSFGLNDVFISKLSASGNYVLVDQLGGGNNDQGNSIVIDAPGNVYTTGYFNATADFDPGAGIFNLTSAGIDDIFVHKMSQCIVPPAPTNTTSAANMAICYNTSATLSVIGYGSLGWYSAATGGTYLGTGSPFTTNTLTNTTTFYVQDSICGTSGRTAITVTVNPQILSNLISQTNVLCNGAATGAATVTASGGTGSLTYSWSPIGGTSATATGLMAGPYTCIITDANSCTKNQTVTITEPTAITSNISSQTNVLCNGGSNGSVTVNASGGTGSLTYSWSPSGGTSATETGLVAGPYTCIITDANSCTKIQTVTITQPAVVSSSLIAQTNILCNGASTGAATVAASGGSGPFTYFWSPIGGAGPIATGLGAGPYTCTITNSCGSVVQTVTITQPPAITSSMSANTNITCNGGSNGAITITASGGTGVLTYSWSPGGQTTTSILGLMAGSYTYTITDANSCTQIQSILISDPPAIVSSQTLTICFGNSVIVGSNTYSTTGIYTDTLTAANSCDSTVTTNLTVNSAINISTSLSGVTITANQTGANYQWIDCNNSNLPISGATGQSYTATTNGNYAVVVTVGSCSDTSACVAVTSTGVKEIGGVQNIRIYPNPSYSGEFTIELDKESKITITDALGREIESQVYHTGKNQLFLNEETNGLYFLQVKESDNIKIYKLLINK